MKRFYLIIAVALLVGLLLPGCQSTRNKTGSYLIDAGELQEFTDEFFPRRMKKLHIPGLVFVLVQGDEIILSKGYGLASLEKSTPINPDLTLMRIGSISKPFVAVAVLQLVEQGKLDLNTDVNHYLTSFKIDDTFSEPITLADLLTHTAGFEDPPYISNIDPLQVKPLGEYLAAHIPPRVHPPGEVFAYCSHGYALAAWIVEDVSGIPFDQFVKQNILEPLGMQHSRYLVAPPLPENLATGYFFQDGAQILQPMDYDNDYPGGSMISTAGDMARFMLAHLHKGCYNNICILQPETLAQMHQKQAQTPYQGQSTTFGFVEGVFGDDRIIGHSGAIRGFGSILDLFPEENIGYFFSFNEECYQTSACKIIAEFREQFLDRFIR